jgi:hypothetical protein
VAVLIIAFTAFIGSCETTKRAHVAKEEELYGTWVNEEMDFEKMVIQPDGTLLIYQYSDINPNLPTFTFMNTIKESWVDKNGKKYFKIHSLQYFLEEPRLHCFVLFRINESGTVLEVNYTQDYEYRSEEDDVPEKYPAEINPNSLDFSYWIYYRQ